MKTSDDIAWNFLEGQPMTNPASPPTATEKSTSCRRRRGIIALVGLGITLALAATRFYVGQRDFSSTGMLQIRPEIRSPIPIVPAMKLVDFDAYVNGQIFLLKSQRVVDLAIEQASQSQAWQAAGRTYSYDKIDDFLHHLEITRDGEIVGVTFTDRNDAVAVEAVKSLFDAYYKLYIEEDQASNRSERQAVMRIRDEYLSKMKSLEVEIDQISNNMGGDAVKARYALLIQSANNAEIAWQHARDMLAEWQTMHNAEISTNPPKESQAEALRAQEQLYLHHFEEATGEVLKLGVALSKINEVQREIAHLQPYVDSARDRLEQMNVQANAPGRIILISTGDRPIVHPSHLWLTLPSGFAILYFGSWIVSGAFRRNRRRHA